jgi:YD repeat-containing protein
VNHLSAFFTITNDALGRMKTHATSGNYGGANAPPFENTLVPLSQGNVSAPSGEAKGSPSLRIAVPARSASYVYGASGNRQSQTVDGVTTDYQYNALNQLISETSTGKTVTHTYDELGNEIGRVTSVSGQPQGRRCTVQPPEPHVGARAQPDGGGVAVRLLAGGGRRRDKNLGTNTSELYIPGDGDVVTDYDKVAGGAPTLKNTYVQGSGDRLAVMRLPASSAASWGTRWDGGATMDDTGRWSRRR